MNTNKSWAIVLAAGEGTRLRELTTRGGKATPKQFCSLRGGRSLLGDALARAARVVPKKRIVVVVAEEHREFWAHEFAALPPENVVVQPANKGTAAGILLPLSAVLERDPEAKVAVLPSDHFVAREYVLESSLRLALESLDELDDAITLLGITPDAPETGYGWIVPAQSQKILRPIERFVEKPEATLANQLFARGGVWNSFLFAARGASLLAHIERRIPALTTRFRSAFAAGSSSRSARLAELYAGLDSHDFSRHVLEGSEERLRLEIVPPCGWTDLGTPARVAACIAALQLEEIPAPFPDGSVFDLAHALRRRGGEHAALTA